MSTKPNASRVESAWLTGLSAAGTVAEFHATFNRNVAKAVGLTRISV